MDKMFNGIFGTSKPKEQDIKNLTDLGFTREKVLEALKKFNNDPAMAANHLFASYPGSS